MLYDALDVVLYMDPMCLDAFPKLVCFKKRIEAIPQIDKYLKSSKYIAWPLQGWQATFGGGDHPPKSDLIEGRGIPGSGGSLKRSCSPSPPPSTGYNHPSYGYKPNQAPPSSSYQKALPEDNRRGHEYVRAVLWNKNNQYGPFYPTSTTLSYSASAAPAPTAPVQTIYTYAGQFAHAQPPSSSSGGPPPPPPPAPQPSQSQVRGEPPPPPQESQPPPPGNSS